MYVNVLRYAQRRYLWWALLLLVFSTAVYFSQDAALPRSGGSWQGYLLGGVALLMVLWLAWLGVRKRSYRSEHGSLQGWVSAHVYLGLALPLVATLHGAFQFGYNIHTLAYVLMIGVVLSGFYGLYGYLRFPRLMVANRADQPFGERLQELDKLDKQGLDIAAQCDDAVQAVVGSAIERTAIGGGLWDQLLARDRSRLLVPDADGRGSLRNNVAQQAVIDYLVEKIPNTSKPGEAERLRELLYVFGRRNEVLRRLRREISLQLRLRFWLVFHVPLTIAFLAALLVHVFTVFFYW